MTPIAADDTVRVENLDTLGAMAGALDAPPAGSPGAPMVDGVDTLAKDWVDTFKMLRGMGMVALERVRGIPPAKVKEIWSDSQLKEMAEPAAEICRRHGVSIGDLLDKWGPYIGLIVAAGVPAFATYELLATPTAPVPPADGQQQ